MAPGGVRDRPDRGQTGLDYLVGIGVFLLTVGFVLAFLPGTLTPFSDASERPLVADRAADTVVAGFADGPEPNVLNATYTEAFFDGTGTYRFDNTKTTTQAGLRSELGVPPFTRVNVTLERSVTGNQNELGTREILCSNGGSFVVCSSPPTGTRLATGLPAPADGSVVTATRAVYVDGQDAVVVVRVW